MSLGPTTQGLGVCRSLGVKDQALYSVIASLAFLANPVSEPALEESLVGGGSLCRSLHSLALTWAPGGRKRRLS